METIIIDRAELNNKLQVLSKAVNTNNVNPVLCGFLFEVANTAMHITASNLEITITSSVTVLKDIIEDDVYVNFVIEAKTIIELVKALSDKNITIIINDENNTVTIEYVSGKYEIPMLGVKDYPKPKPVKVDHIKFSVDSEIISRGISRTVFAVLNDINFPALSGINIAIEDGVLSFAATDRRKMASIDNKILSTSASGSFILAGRVGVIIKDTLTKYNGVVDVAFDDNVVVFDSKEYIIHARTVVAKFPNYRGILSRNDGDILTINRDLLASAIERTSLCTSKLFPVVKIKVQSNVLSISVQDLINKKTAKEDLPCSYNNTDISFGLVLSNISEITKAIHSTNVVFKIKSPVLGIIITPESDYQNETLVMMTMPVALS